MWKYVAGASIIALVSFSGLSYWYYKTSQQRIEKLQTDNASLTIVAATNQETINQLLLQQAINQKRLDDLADKLLEAEQYVSELRRILQKHDLTRLAEERPGLIERRINEATRKIFDSIVLSTGSR
jgi:hypothetical protein